MAKKKITPVCFWCGHDMPEIDKPDEVKLKKGSVPPHRMIISYEPCLSCKEIFSHGIQVYAVDKEPVIMGQVPVGMDKDDDGNEYSIYPTGQYFLAPEEWVEQVFPDESKDIIKRGVMGLPAEAVERIIDASRQDPETIEAEYNKIQKENEELISKEENVD